MGLGLAAACEKEESLDPPRAVQAGTGGMDAGHEDATAPDGGQAGAPADAERKGERGDSCDSTNDCGENLSCIVTNDCPVGVACANKSCQPSNFDIMGTGKQCHIVDCATKADCCGDMPLEAPEKCVNRDSICFQPSLPGCIATACTEDADCGLGTCSGSCTLDGELCLTTPNCAVNTCGVSGGAGAGGAGEPDTCTITGTDCSTFSCTTNICTTPFCKCANPDYDPLDPICTDPDCEDICGFVCEEELCIVDMGCDVDLDCPVTTPFCDQGECVECLTSDDCEEEECVDGHCGPVCEVDTQCSLFESCQNNECVFIGCQSDRECVLSASAADPSQDPRLAKCNIENGIGTCVFPCEIDAQCAPTEICLEGVCEYIGCETDGECKTIAGLHNQPVPTHEHPWTTKAECREEINP